MSAAYIQNGRITHSKPSSRFSWSRCLLVFAVLGALFITNPANDYLILHPTSEKDNTSWFGSLFAPVETNYGVFLLTKSLDEISMTVAFQTFELCDFHSPDEDELMNLVCGWIDDTFCHGKPLLDWSDLPYTANRLLCWLLLASMLFQFCLDGSSTRSTSLMSVLASVLIQPTFYDVIRVNIIVYPALVSIDRLIRSYLVTDGYTWQFFLTFFVLIFVTGGIGNQMGSLFQRESVIGMGAALSACLGYYRASSSASSLFRFVDTPFTASTIFWLDAAMLFLQQRPGNLVAWIAGGMSGHAFGQVHRQWLAEALRSNASRTIDRTVRKVFNL